MPTKLAPVEFSKCIGRHAPITGLLANPDIRDIIITARWAAYSEGKGVDGGVVTRVRKFAETGVDANRDEFFRLLRETIKTLLYGGRRITIIGPVPELPRNLPTTLIKDKMRGQVRDYALAREDFVKRQFNMRPICPTVTPITGPASHVPKAGPARKPTKLALPSNTKRRLRSTVELRSAM